MHVFNHFLIALAWVFCFSTSSDVQTVVIDAGHGGKDHGLQQLENLEKDFTLELSRSIRNLNSDKQLQIVLLRESDTYLSYDERLRKVQEIDPDLLISLHLAAPRENKDETETELKLSSKSEHYQSSLEFAQRLQAKLAAQKANSTLSEGRYYMLENSPCPAVLLNIGNDVTANSNETQKQEIQNERLAKAILGALSSK